MLSSSNKYDLFLYISDLHSHYLTTKTNEFVISLIYFMLDGVDAASGSLIHL